eukprot:scaffold155_cov57-Attheya_sp.AAC.1
MVMVTECIDTGCLHRYWIPRQNLRFTRQQIVLDIVPGPDDPPRNERFTAAVGSSAFVPPRRRHLPAPWNRWLQM